MSYESKLLKTLNAKNNPLSFNMHNGDGKFSTQGVRLSEEWKKKISVALTGLKRSDIAKEHYRAANQLKAKDPEYLRKLRKPKPNGTGRKISLATTGIKKSKSHCIAMSKAKKGIKTGPCSEKRRLAIQKALKGKHTLPLIICPHCSRKGRANMKRWHFDNCKEKK